MLAVIPPLMIRRSLHQCSHRSNPAKHTNYNNPAGTSPVKED